MNPWSVLLLIGASLGTGAFLAEHAPRPETVLAYYCGYARGMKLAADRAETGPVRGCARFGGLGQ